uniref:Checkpoint protein RAD24-like helical bundle domain-containing protein n=1 Tax=Strigamia maritima TaxID=126957 RepID=T1J1L8_STRMM
MNNSRGQKRSWVMSSFQDGNEKDGNNRDEEKVSGAPSKGRIIRQHSDDKLKNITRKNSLWIDKYQPINIEELAVHKKKINEIEEWIVKYFSNSSDNGVRKSSILLLTGPSGIGKTATIKTLAKCLNLEIKEWITPISDFKRDLGKINSTYDNRKFEYRDAAIPYESQLVKFWDFFLRANKYSSLAFLNENEGLRRIILIEDFPNIFIRNPSDFHSTLRRFNKSSHSPAIFIISDNIKDLNTKSMFPQDLQQELGINTINFNPITTVNLLKILTKISAAELSSIPSKEILENIAQTTSGDIRAAINTLQFSHCGKKRNTARADKKKESIKDTTLYLFHAIGKVLHCKRETTLPTDECDLPPHLINMARTPLISNPEDIVSNAGISSDCLHLFVHHNYLKFNDDINEVVRASRYLSDSDILMSEWTGHSTLEKYSSLVAVRGVMHAKRAGTSMGWHPLHKPFWYTANKLVGCWNEKVR